MFLVIQNAAIGSNTRAMGSAHIIHCPNEIGAPIISVYTPINTRLGGVPMGVAMPPMLAA